MTQAIWCPGRFVWWELHTPDVAKSKAFYEAVVGWKIAPVEVGSIRYTMIHVGDQGIAGMAPLSDSQRQAGHPPFWMAYVSVLDVDAAAAAATSAGGKVLVGPVDTLSWQEVLNAGRDHGYAYEGVAAYLFPETAGQCPQ